MTTKEEAKDALVKALFWLEPLLMGEAEELVDAYEAACREEWEREQDRELAKAVAETGGGTASPEAWKVFAYAWREASKERDLLLEAAQAFVPDENGVVPADARDYRALAKAVRAVKGGE